MEKWKVRPKKNWKHGKLGPKNWEMGNWKTGKLGPKIKKLEKWKARPKRFGKLEKWKVKPRKIWKIGKLGPEKLENWKVRPRKIRSYAPERCICKRQLQERTSAVLKLLRKTTTRTYECSVQASPVGVNVLV